VRVTIHQPEHLPWLGFFAKVSAADHFIVLDSVPYRHHYFQNRNRIQIGDRVDWVTVPVRHRGHLSTRIADMTIDESRPWRRKYLGRIRDAYRRAAHADEAIEPLVPAIEGCSASLINLNMQIMTWLMAELGVDVPTKRASAMAARGQRSELLAGLSAEAGAAVYLAGPSARDYLDLEQFRRRGIAVEFYDFAHPEYAQGEGPGFYSHLATIDLLAHYGRDGARDVMASALRESASRRE
jgi:hypothetical protein